MSDLVAAADDVTVTALLRDAETAFGVRTGGPDTGSLGPFVASVSGTASFSDGSVTLERPNLVDIADLHLNLTISLSLTVDLNRILPELCLPQVCVDFFGEICTPRICIPWPTVTIPLHLSDTVGFSGSFELDVRMVGGYWYVDIVIAKVPYLDLGATAVALLTVLGGAASVALVGVPFIGPFLAAAVAGIVATIDVAEITGLLGPLVSSFVSGLSFTVYKQPQNFQVLPAAGPFDPAVSISLADATAEVRATDKNQLVVAVEI